MEREHPANYVDLTGQRFGMLTVIERAGNNSSGSALWRCICDCNNETIVRTAVLNNGHTASCGCQKLQSRLRHGMNNTPLYSSWECMKARCNNPHNIGYSNYGGRGIQVCDEWNDFVQFMEWANVNGYKEGLTLDRIDVNGNYEPDNCRWATKQEQANNRRTCIMITYFGETHSLKDWCRILNLPYSIIRTRMNKLNWDFWTAISTPLPDHYYDGYYDESDYYDYNDYDNYYEDPSEYDSYPYY